MLSVRLAGEVDLAQEATITIDKGPFSLIGMKPDREMVKTLLPECGFESHSGLGVSFVCKHLGLQVLHRFGSEVFVFPLYTH